MVSSLARRVRPTQSPFGTTGGASARRAKDNPLGCRLRRQTQRLPSDASTVPASPSPRASPPTVPVLGMSVQPQSLRAILNPSRFPVLHLGARQNDAPVDHSFISTDCCESDFSLTPPLASARSAAVAVFGISASSVRLRWQSCLLSYLGESSKASESPQRSEKEVLQPLLCFCSPICAVKGMPISPCSTSTI